MVLNKNLKKILDWSSRDLNDLISSIIATRMTRFTLQVSNLSTICFRLGLRKNWSGFENFVNIARTKVEAVHKFEMLALCEGTQSIFIYL